MEGVRTFLSCNCALSGLQQCAESLHIYLACLAAAGSVIGITVCEHIRMQPFPTHLLVFRSGLPVACSHQLNQRGAFLLALETGTEFSQRHVPVVVHGRKVPRAAHRPEFPPTTLVSEPTAVSWLVCFRKPHRLYFDHFEALYTTHFFSVWVIS